MTVDEQNGSRAAEAPLSNPKALSTAVPRPPRVRGGSLGQHEAESHVPSLKNQGKSDCSVRIISILDAHTDIPAEEIGVLDPGWNSLDMCSVLRDARSAAPAAPGKGGFDMPRIAGSRTYELQKAQRRPALEQRTSSQGDLDVPAKPTSKTSRRQAINSKTMRRLTSGMWCVRKEAFGGAKQDGTRLLRQIEKQLRFSARCRSATLNMRTTVSTPEIFGISMGKKNTPSAGGIVVDMEYIPFSDVQHIMLERDRISNEWLIDSVIELVDANLLAATLTSLAEVLPVFAKKAASIKASLATSSLATDGEKKGFETMVDRVLQHYTGLGNLKVPIGSCHGDLTFTNMLVDVDNRELCVFDFLDCFVESPLQDIAKLLQDARHGWFLTQINIPQNRRARAVSMLSLFYEKIRAAYCGYVLWDIVPLFEFFCLARILPYMTKTSEKICILNGLRLIYGDLFGPTQPDAGDDDANDVRAPLVDLTEPYDGDSDGNVTVIVPAMGEAMGSPYPGGQVKLLTPTTRGVPLIVDAISSLDTRNVSRIVVVVLREIIETRLGSTTSFEQLFAVLGSEKQGKLVFLYADEQKADAVETVTFAISMAGITGSIFIKDADNDFSHVVDAGNYLNFTSVVHSTAKNVDDNNSLPSPPGTPGILGFSNMNSMFLRPDLVDAVHKSYVSFVYDNVVSNIVYGSFLSSYFCCGGWGFLRASDFVNAARKLRVLLVTSPPPSGAGGVAAAAATLGSGRGGVAAAPAAELRVLDVMWQLISEGHLFFGQKVSLYRDWGSEAAWIAAIKTSL